MSEHDVESVQVETESTKRWGNWNAVAVIVAIIAVTIITLACIAACTLTAYVFITNAPW